MDFLRIPRKLLSLVLKSLFSNSEPSAVGNVDYLPSPELKVSLAKPKNKKMKGRLVNKNGKGNFPRLAPFTILEWDRDKLVIPCDRG